MQVPRGVEAGPAIGVSECDGWHRMDHFCKRRIEGDFVSAQVILVADAAGLDNGKISGSERRGAMMFLADDQLHGSRDGPVGVLEQLAAHLFRKRNQCGPLRVIGALVNEQDRPGWIGIGVGVSQSCIRSHRRRHGKAIQRNAVPGTRLDTPGENAFITDEIDFTICETLAGIDVGGASFNRSALAIAAAIAT